MNWPSRRVLAWQASNILERKCCIDARQEALALYGLPDILNSDPRGQFTIQVLRAVMKARRVQISMDC